MARCPAGHESQTSDYCDTCGAVMGGSPVTPAPLLESTALLGADPGAAGSGAGGACPNCGAERGGRFCEECGFDYELAELLPSVPAAAGAAQPEAGPELNGHVPAAVETGSSQPPDPQPAGPGSGPLEAPPVAPSPDEAAAGGPDTDGSAAESAHQPPAAPVSAQPLAVVVTADHEYYAAQVERGDIIEAEFPFPKYPGERRFSLDADVIRIGRASASRGIAVEIDLTGPPLDPAVSHLHAQLSRGEDGGWLLVDLGSANGTRLNGAEQPVPIETEVPVKAGDRIHVGVWTTLTLEEV